MDNMQHVMATIMEDALMKSEFPKEHKKMKELESQYQDARAELYKKTIKKIKSL